MGTHYSEEALTLVGGTAQDVLRLIQKSQAVGWDSRSLYEEIAHMLKEYERKYADMLVGDYPTPHGAGLALGVERHHRRLRAAMVILQYPTKENKGLLLAECL